MLVLILIHIISSQSTQRDLILEVQTAIPLELLEQAAQGSGEVTDSGNFQEMCRCGTEGHGLVGILW